MRIFAGIVGMALLALVLWDVFENIILPRHVVRKSYSARNLAYAVWLFWRACARRMKTGKRRETFLSYFGPLALLLMFAAWAACLIVAFAALFWAGGSTLRGAAETPGFRNDLYMSGTTFFTLGLGDVTPGTTFTRLIAVCEVGMGFSFLAVVISYLPALYGAFSQREVNISLLDARAGSPPTAAELLRRHGPVRVQNGLGDYLGEWEVWCGQIMETHLSYPVLCFYRSQHDNQSWLAAFTAILDVCSLLIAYGEGETKWRAQLTFAIARHAIADLCEIMRIQPRPLPTPRLLDEDLPEARALLLRCAAPNCSPSGDAKLRELQSLYEPYLHGLSRLLFMELPHWGVGRQFASQPRSAIWKRIASPSGPDPAGTVDDSAGHFGTR